MPVVDTRKDAPNPSPRTLDGSRRMLGLAGAGLLILGGAAGAVVVAETRPSVSMAPANPVAIRTLSTSGIVTIRGRVAEIFGNKVIVADASGRALVDLGREGDDRQLLTAGEAITVQGRFDRGFIHAAFLVGPDNKVVALGPLAGPPHGPHGRHGPDDGPDGPPTGAEHGPDGPPPATNGSAAALPAGH